jgi:hypothetical protein
VLALEGKSLLFGSWNIVKSLSALKVSAWLRFDGLFRMTVWISKLIQVQRWAGQSGLAIKGLPKRVCLSPFLFTVFILP